MAYLASLDECNDYSRVRGDRFADSPAEVTLRGSSATRWPGSRGLACRRNALKAFGMRPWYGVRDNLLHSELGDLDAAAVASIWTAIRAESAIRALELRNLCYAALRLLVFAARKIRPVARQLGLGQGRLQPLGMPAVPVSVCWLASQDAGRSAMRRPPPGCFPRRWCGPGRRGSGSSRSGCGQLASERGRPGRNLAGRARG